MNEAYDNEQNEEIISMSSKHAKKHDDSEAIWLISYSDLMTLLMGFFALLLSMSKLDDTKMAVMQEEAVKKFGGEYQRPLKDLQNDLQKLVAENNLADQISIESDPTGVIIVFKGTVLFDSGSITLNAAANALSDKFVALIKEKANQNLYFLFEGHTDSSPINKEIVASNWELSGLRASAMARKFQTQGFDRFKMTVIGWGDTKPLVKEQDENGQIVLENQAKNRRILIKVSNSKISI